MPKKAVSPLIAIVGQTASGKSALAMELAQKLNGEIISADARMVYKGMDIGTAKPSLADRTLIPHYIIDIVNPDQTFSAAEFKELASKAIEDITSRKKLPILVGGTGLYVDAVLFNFSFNAKADSIKRAELNKLSIEELQAELEAEGIPLPENIKNPRHLIRALETGGAPAEQQPLRENALVLGTEVDASELKKRINERITKMMEQGLRREANDLVNMYGWEAPGMNAIGYKEWRILFSGETIEQSKVEKLIQQNTWQYAKRQKTWFNRNKSIQWVQKQSDAVDIATTFMNKS